jgi:hypothetical protein
MKKFPGYLALNLISTASSPIKDPMAECELGKFRWFCLAILSAASFGIAAACGVYLMIRRPQTENNSTKKLVWGTGLGGGLILGFGYLVGSVASLPDDSYCSFSA